MNKSDVSKTLDKNELDTTQVEEVAGGVNFCTAEEYLTLTESFKSAYENLVDFTSHVIERIAGGSGTA
ncbi:MAG: hypothetical protein IPP91_10835 [Betaproteobacteria bacterium]|nr:hypothetical protein [Betaproteobacteria bacterium]